MLCAAEGGALFQIAQATSSEKAYDHIADMRVLGLGADVGGSGSSSLYAGPLPPILPLNEVANNFSTRLRPSALPEAMGGELKLADEEPTLFEEELEQRAAGKAPEMPMEHEEYFGASNSSMGALITIIVESFRFRRDSQQNTIGNQKNAWVHVDDAGIQMPFPSCIPSLRRPQYLWQLRRRA